MLTLLVVLLMAVLAFGAGEFVRGQCRRMLLSPVVEAHRAQRPARQL